MILRRRLRARLADAHAVCQLPKPRKAGAEPMRALPLGDTMQQPGAGTPAAPDNPRPPHRTSPKVDECELKVCGKPLGRNARHSCHCEQGPFRLAAHNRVGNVIAAKLAKAGATTQCEKYIPELYKRTDKGEWQEAKLDVVVSWPLTPTCRLLDVSIRSAHKCGGMRSAGKQRSRPNRIRSGDMAQALKQSQWRWGVA